MRLTSSQTRQPHRIGGIAARLAPFGLAPERLRSRRERCPRIVAQLRDPGMRLVQHRGRELVGDERRDRQGRHDMKPGQMSAEAPRHRHRQGEPRRAMRGRVDVNQEITEEQPDLLEE